MLNAQNDDDGGDPREYIRDHDNLHRGLRDGRDHDGCDDRDHDDRDHVWQMFR